MNKKILIVAIIVCISFFVLSLSSRFTSYFQKYSPLQFLSQSFQGLFNTAISGTIDDIEAKRVIGVIKDRCGVDLAQYIDIKKDTSLSFPSYKIEGSQVTYNGDSRNNTALYALARVSEDLLEAKMLWPGDDGIFCKTKPSDEQIKNILGVYKKEWRPNYEWVQFFSANPSRDERTWFQWNHMSTDLTDPYTQTSMFKGLAIKYPYLAVDKTAKDTTKINLLHPDVPKIIYDKWVAEGRRGTVNLFEIDGSNYETSYMTPPEGLNEFDLEAFKKSVYWAQPIGVDGDTLSKKTSQYYKDNLRKWLPFASNDRLILTPVYLRSYKSVEKYFQEQGVNNVRFNILSYHAYYYLPPGELIPDLSNFDVYYTSPGATRWNRASMEADITNYNRWKSSGARMVWRPNISFNYLLDPTINLNLYNEFVTRTKPKYFQISGSTNILPGIQGINSYTMFRTIEGRSPSQALDDYVSAFDPVNQPLIREYVSIAENTIENKEKFTDSKLNQMKAVFDRGSSDRLMQQFKMGVEIALKKNEYIRASITRAQASDWYSDQLQSFPGLGTLKRFEKNLDDELLFKEDPILPIDPIDPVGPTPTTIPALGTSTATSATPYTLTLLSSITSTGGVSPTERGFHYGLTSSYGTSLPERATFDAGPFSLTVVNLACAKTYYIRSFAINSKGIAYGSDSSAQTAPCPEIKDEPKKEDPLPPKELPKTPEKVPTPEVIKTQEKKPVTQPTPVPSQKEFTPVIQRKELILTPSTSVFIPKGQATSSPEMLKPEDVLPPPVQNTQKEELTLEELLRRAKEALQLVLLFYR
jgi:hypothetical protein